MAKIIYDDIQLIMEIDRANCTVFSTSEFECPVSGWGCLIHWNINTGQMWVEICTYGIWNTTRTIFTREISRLTYKWAEDFGIKDAKNARDANNILNTVLGKDKAIFYQFEE
jgi:hypothetical protein